MPQPKTTTKGARAPRRMGVSHPSDKGVWKGAFRILETFRSDNRIITSFKDVKAYKDPSGVDLETALVSYNTRFQVRLAEQLLLLLIRKHC